MKIYALILAAGTGTRFSNEEPKQFIRIAGKTVLEHTIEIFEKNDLIDEIVVVTLPSHKKIIKKIIIKNNYKKIKKLLNGGNSRKESSFVGIDSIKDENSIVLIHDSVRPFLSNKIIANCIDALKKYDAVDVAIQASDTIIKVDTDKIIESIPDRKFMMRGQTPQCFKTRVIKKAHQLAIKNGDNNFTDDCGLILKYKLGKIFVVNGEEKNIKITYPEDIFLADKLFQINNTTIDDRIRLDGLKDKSIIIFGDSSGIGKCIKIIAEKFKANVFGYSRTNNINVSNLENVKRAVNNVIAKNGKVDFVIDTAGVLNIGKLEDKKEKEIIDEIETNYIGAINIAKASLPSLKKTNGSLLFFTSSSYTRGRALYSIYSSTKSAIVNLTQALSEELFDENVRINVMNPERTATPMRFKNFGNENPETLLDPMYVANKSLQVLLSNFTGQVINIKK